MAFLEQTFGTIPAEIEPKIRAAADLAIREAAIGQVVRLNTLAELRLEKSPCEAAPRAIQFRWKH